MARPEHHVFVCMQNRPADHPKGSCGAQADGNLLEQFHNAVMKYGLGQKVMVSGSSCLGPCHLGPNVLIYPEGTMYSQISSADVERIVTSHLRDNEVVTEKLTPAEVW